MTETSPEYLGRDGECDRCGHSEEHGPKLYRIDIHHTGAPSSHHRVCASCAQAIMREDAPESKK